MAIMANEGFQPANRGVPAIRAGYNIGMAYNGYGNWIMKGLFI